MKIFTNKTRRNMSAGAAVLLLWVGAMALDLATPAVVIPKAQASFGVAYTLDGNTITNGKVPSLVNRFTVQTSLSPLSFLNVGIDFGAASMEVTADTSTTDTFRMFRGGYGPAVALHCKLSTPFFFNQTVAFIGMVKGGYFSSQNENGAIYGAIDGIGGCGAQIHIKKIGYLSMGPVLYYMKGMNQSYTGTQSYYSNVNNLRGWAALDIFPPKNMTGNTLLYVSIEASISPDVTLKGKAPIQEASLSISIGTVTKRLYGEQENLEWEP